LTLVDCVLTSGAEIVATRIAMALDRRRFESLICTTRPSPSRHVREVEEAGIRIVALDRRSTLDLSRWRPFIELLRSEQVDVVHSHKHGSNVWAASLGRLAGAPVVICHEHSWVYVRSNIGQHVKQTLDRQLVARSADVILGTSRAHWQHLVRGLRVSPAKARYVSNGIPTMTAGNGRAVRQELGISAASPVIGTVCTLRPEKALEVLIESARILLEDIPALEVVIVGDGPERGRLEAMVERLNLAGSVKFLGRRPPEALPDLLAAFDVGVLSSDFEASPLSVLEFMAAGKPVVATRVGGVPALVEDGGQGLLVPPRDPQSLACAALTLLRDRELRRALGANGQQRQRHEFHFDRMVRQLEDLYECLYRSSERGRSEADARFRAL
jgi:glycosyltransferase involved in cell wall biosynthesis